MPLDPKIERILLLFEKDHNNGIRINSQGKMTRGAINNIALFEARNKAIRKAIVDGELNPGARKLLVIDLMRCRRAINDPAWKISDKRILREVEERKGILESYLRPRGRRGQVGP